MINKIFTFTSKAKEFLKGKKVYLAALIIILQALLTYIEQIIALNGLSDLIIWCKDLTSNEASLHLLEGLGLFGLRAALGKSETKTI